MFPFARFPGVDVVLGPEMKSTGEVMGLDRNFARAFAKAQMGAGHHAAAQGHMLYFRQGPRQGRRDPDGLAAGQSRLRSYRDLGHRRGVAEAGVPVRRVNKVYEGQPHIVDAMINGEVQMMINTTAEGAQTLADSFSLRRTALMQGIPQYTTIPGARAAIEAISALQSGGLRSGAACRTYLRLLSR